MDSLVVTLGRLAKMGKRLAEDSFSSQDATQVSVGRVVVGIEIQGTLEVPFRPLVISPCGLLGG